MGSEEGGTERRPAQHDFLPDPITLEFRFRPPERGGKSVAEDAEQSDVTSAELARQLNASIYKVGLSLADQREQEFQLTFFCACGLHGGGQAFPSGLCDPRRCRRWAHASFRGQPLVRREPRLSGLRRQVPRGPSDGEHREASRTLHSRGQPGGGSRRSSDVDPGCSCPTTR